MQLAGHKKEVNHASFSPDGRRIATASQDNIVRVWNAESGKIEIELNVGTGSIRSVMFNFDGKYLVASCDDQTARIWSLGGGEVIAVLRGHEDGLYYAEFSPNGELVMTAGQDQKAHIWEFSTGKTLLQLPNAQDAAITQASFSPDGNLIVTTDSTGYVTVYTCEICGDSREELLALAHKRKARELTAAERSRYLIFSER
jgi:WD40 repeat protein